MQCRGEVTRIRHYSAQSIAPKCNVMVFGWSKAHKLWRSFGIFATLILTSQRPTCNGKSSDCCRRLWSLLFTSSKLGRHYWTDPHTTNIPTLWGRAKQYPPMDSTRVPGTANLTPRPITRYCHIANSLAWWYAWLVFRSMNVTHLVPLKIKHLKNYFATQFYFRS